MRFSRRGALLRTVAVTAAGLIPGAAIPSLAAPARPQFRNDEIDAALQARVDAAEVPGGRCNGRDGAVRDLSGRIRRAKHRCARKDVGRYGL